MSDTSHYKFERDGQDEQDTSTATVSNFIRSLSRSELEMLATNCAASCAKKHFAAHGAITHISQAIAWMDLSGDNPEDNSQLVWNHRFDDIRRALVYALDGLKEVT